MKYSMLLCVLFCLACTNKDSISSDQNTTNPEIEWDINTNNLTQGAPYALITEPNFTSVTELSLQDNEEVIIIKTLNEIKVYPLRYLNFSEVINDEIEGIPVAITNCPQTKSSICFVREFQGETLNLKASGYLYNQNQVYANDEETIFWSQMLLEKIKGNNKYKLAKTYPSLKTVWSTVSQFYPEAKVYFREEQVANRRKSISQKQTINQLDIGIIDNSKFEKEVYIFNKSDVNTYQEVFIGNIKTLVYNNSEQTISTVLKLPTGQITYTNSFPDIFIDSDNNTWDVFGFCVSGERVGDRLESHVFYEAEDWAWELFFKNITYNN